MKYMQFSIHIWRNFLSGVEPAYLIIFFYIESSLLNIMNLITRGGFKMKNKSNLTGLIFAVLFFILSIPKFYKKEYMDGVFCIVAVIGFLLIYFASNVKKLK